MIISVDKNRKYNGMLNDIRESISPGDTSKEFRQTIKMLDPDFPVGDNGEKISMRDITDDDFEDHLSFVKTMCLRRGVRLDYFNDGDVMVAREAEIGIRIGQDIEESDGMIIVGIVCSNCGAETIRGLSDARYEEVADIVSGKREESFDPVTDSFICAGCIVLDKFNGGVDAEDYSRECV